MQKCQVGVLEHYEKCQVYWNIMNGTRAQVRLLGKNTKVQKCQEYKSAKSTKVPGVQKCQVYWNIMNGTRAQVRWMKQLATRLLARSFQLQRGRGSQEENALNFNIFCQLLPFSRHPVISEW